MFNVIFPLSLPLSPPSPSLSLSLPPPLSLPLLPLSLSLSLSLPPLSLLPPPSLSLSLYYRNVTF